MANIWSDKRTLNNENSQYAPLKSKQAMSNISRSAKKQAFGEIKNVMHNQIGATPLKGNAAKIDGLPSVFNASKSLCNEVLRKQQMKQNFADAQHKLERKHKITEVTKAYKQPAFDQELFDSWDLNRACCKQQKSDEEIWSEMSSRDIDFGGFHFDTTLKDVEEKELMDVCTFIPELDDLPELPEIDLMEDLATTDFETSKIKLPDFSLFNNDILF